MSSKAFKRLKEKAQKLQNEIPAVYVALCSKSTPTSAKIFAALTVCYALSPIDLIPDFIPVLGLFDDALILPFLLTVTLKLIPKEQMEHCRKQAQNIKNEKKWYYALPIVLFWCIVVIIITKAIFAK